MHTWCMETRQQLLPVGPMARRLRVPVAWLKSEANANRIPHLRAGQVILFHPEIVESVLVERAKQADGVGK